MKMIKHNRFIIAKSYNDLMETARYNFDNIERGLISKIILTAYEKSEKVKKTYLESTDLYPEDIKPNFSFPIEKWKELKLYGRFLQLNEYGISLEYKINESLKKYNLDDIIQAEYFIPYDGTDGTMYINCVMADKQELLQEK